MKALLKKVVNKVDSEYGRYSIARHGFWFVDIPRTSSSSIRSELGTRFGRAHGKGNVIEQEHATQQIFEDHLSARKMRAVLGRSIWNKIFTFTVVRNPWDRTYSMYNYRKKMRTIPEAWSFRDYVIALETAGPETKYFEYHGYRYGASDYVLGKNNQVLVDFIARYETRSQDLSHIGSAIKVENFGKLFIQKATPENNHYSRFYDAETREIIQRLYSKDAELFGYEFGGET